MLKYKDTYKVTKVKDKNNIPSSNRDDNYIPCAKAQIYRYDFSTLVIQFYTNKYANNRIKELTAIGVQLTILQRGDDEQTYTFLETELSKVADICKAKKKRKINLTEEQKEVLRNRLENIRRK